MSKPRRSSSKQLEVAREEPKKQPTTPAERMQAGVEEYRKAHPRPLAEQVKTAASILASLLIAILLCIGASMVACILPANLQPNTQAQQSSPMTQTTNQNVSAGNTKSFPNTSAPANVAP